MLSMYPSQEAPIWIDLVDPTDQEKHIAQRASGFAIPSREQLNEIESSSRVHTIKDTLYLNMPVVSALEGRDLIPPPLGFILSAHLLVTLRYTELSVFEQAKKHFQAGAACSNSTEVFATLVDGIADAAADRLEQIGAQLNGLSQDVFRRYAKPTRHDVARNNRRLRDTLVAVGVAGEYLSQIRDSLLGLQRIVPFAIDKGQSWIGPDLQPRLKTVQQDIQSLADYEVHLSNKAQFLLDAVLGFINTEQNDIFKVLTIVSVVGIPPTLIASMYGMNFHFMPEYAWTWGYAWGLGLIFLSIIIPVAWFKWRGWW